MSNLGLSMQDSTNHSGQAPKKSKKRGRKGGGAAVLIALLVVVGLVAVVGYGGYLVSQKLQGSVPAADYDGPGTGEVVVEIVEGETLTDIGATLQQADVVASTQSFAEAASLNQEATSITPGAYLMLQQMNSSDAVERLLDPNSRNENVVTVTEGMRVKEIVLQLSDVTGLPEKQFRAALDSPQLPLPDWAEGVGEFRSEGFLFPATYQFQKDDTAQDIVNSMVMKFNEVTDAMNFAVKAEKTGYSPYEVLNIASLIQAEAHESDYGKVSRVIYNRLSEDTWGETYGYLGLDATLNFILDQKDTNITESDLNTQSPYNTRTEFHQGLPPTPINNPGEDTLKAALDPDTGSWLYYATVNLKTGETKFTDSYNEFLGYQQELREYEQANPQN